MARLRAYVVKREGRESLMRSSSWISSNPPAAPPPTEGPTQEIARQAESAIMSSRKIAVFLLHRFVVVAVGVGLVSKRLVVATLTLSGCDVGPQDRAHHRHRHRLHRLVGLLT